MDAHVLKRAEHQGARCGVSLVQTTGGGGGRWEGGCTRLTCSRSSQHIKKKTRRNAPAWNQAASSTRRCGAPRCARADCKKKPQPRCGSARLGSGSEQNCLIAALSTVALARFPSPTAATRGEQRLWHQRTSPVGSVNIC